MRSVVIITLLFILASCTAGPVFVAKNEQEAVRSTYQDPKLLDLYSKNRETLSSIYQRVQLSNVDAYPNGIGFTGLSDAAGKKYYYLLVDVRPRDITFGESQTTPKERFSEVFNRHFQKNLRLVSEQDLRKTGVDGLAFAVHWPVRDLSQCDTHGGFLEYITAYIPKADFMRFRNGQISFEETIDRAEVLASLNRKNAQPIKVVQGE